MEQINQYKSPRETQDVTGAIQGGNQPANTIWLVLTNEDYLPAVSFTVLWELDWIMTARLLRGPDGLLLENRRDYDTYVVEFDYSSVPRYAIIFVPMNQRVNRDQQYVLGRNANFLLDANGLLLTRARRLPSQPISDSARVGVPPSESTQTPTDTPSEGN